MKIAYVSPNAIKPYEASGAEKTIDELLSFMANYNQVMALCTKEKFLLSQKRYDEVLSSHIEKIQVGNYTKYLWNNMDLFWKGYEEKLESFSPEVIFMQLCDITPVAQWVRTHNSKAKIVFYFHGDPGRDIKHLEGLRNFMDYIAVIICVSKSVFNMLPIDLRKKAEVVLPLFQNIRNLKITRMDRFSLERKTVIYFNPIRQKGAAVIKKVSEVLMDLEFDIYKAWNNNKCEYSFDENVHIKGFEDNPLQIYKEAFLYILPSQEIEGLGRGIVEAGAFGIPSLASGLKGMSYNIYDEEYLIDEYWNSEEWINRIKRLIEDAEFYRKSSELALIHTHTVLKQSVIQATRLLERLENRTKK